MSDLAAMVGRVMPMAADIAVQLGHPHGSPLFDDLMGAARLKLVKVAARFDSARGIQWQTFAFVCIKRAMLDEIESATRRRPVATPELEAEAGRPGELSGVDLGDLLADRSIPRLYRRALRAGSVTGVYRSGLPKKESVKVFTWAKYAIRRRLDDRPRQ